MARQKAAAAPTATAEREAPPEEPKHDGDMPPLPEGEPSADPPAETPSEGETPPEGETEPAEETPRAESAFDKAFGKLSAEEQRAFLERAHSELPDEERSKLSWAERERQRQEEDNLNTMVNTKADQARMAIQAAEAQKQRAGSRLNRLVNDIRSSALAELQRYDSDATLPDVDEGAINEAIEEYSRGGATLATRDMTHDFFNELQRVIDEHGGATQEEYQRINRFTAEGLAGVVRGYLSLAAEKITAAKEAEFEKRLPGIKEKLLTSEVAAAVANRLAELELEPSTEGTAPAGPTKEITLEDIKKMTSEEVRKLPREVRHRAIEAAAQ